MNSPQSNVLAGFASSLICAMALVSGRASALTCATNWVQAPADGTTDVPTNARLWGYGFHTALGTRLLGPDGAVALSKSYLPTGGSQYLPVLTPERELDPNARYRIEVDYSDPSASGGVSGEFTEFFTGAGPAEQGPAPLELLSNEPGTGSGLFGISRWRELEFSHGPLLIGDADAALGDARSIDDVAVASESVDFSAPDSGLPAALWFGTGPRIYAGIADCMAWPSYEVERVAARFGAFDLAGNFSGWLDVPLELPSVAEAEAAIEFEEAQAQAEQDARLRAAYEGKHHGQGHVTGCTLTRGTPRRAVAPLAGTAFVLALMCARWRRRTLRSAA